MVWNCILEIIINIVIILIYLISIYFITDVILEKLLKKEYDYFHRILPVILIILVSSVILNKLLNGFLFFEVTMLISLLYAIFLLFTMTVLKKFWNNIYNNLVKNNERE